VRKLTPYAKDKIECDTGEQLAWGARVGSFGQYNGQYGGHISVRQAASQY